MAGNYAGAAVKRLSLWKGMRGRKQRSGAVVKVIGVMERFVGVRARLRIGIKSERLSLSQKGLQNSR
jgi:hypothetical protein